MHSNIEIEAKVLLTKEQYDTVVSYLHLQRYRKIKQTNHYVDTLNRVLKDNDFALRVREKEDLVLTLKTPLSEGLLEKNQTLSWREYEALEDSNIFPHGNIKSFLELCGFDTSELRVLASLTTHRIELEYEDGLVSLDENFYGDNIDYELEIESSSMERAEELVKRLLNEAGITEFKFNKLSKQARALEARNNK